MNTNIVELSMERGRFSKKAQSVLKDMDRYFECYKRAKGQSPPVIRLDKVKLDFIETSVKRLKIKDPQLWFKGVSVIS